MTPACIAVLLPEPRRLRLPCLWHTALLDCRFLGLGVALLGRRHDVGIDDLATHGEVAPLGEGGIEAGEQPVDRLGFDQPLAEEPQRRRVGHRAIKP